MSWVCNITKNLPGS